MSDPHGSGSHSTPGRAVALERGAEPAFDEQARRTRVDELNAEARALRRLDYVRDRQLAEEAFELASQPGEGGRPYTFGLATSLGILAYRNCILDELDEALSQATRALGLLEPLSPSLVLGDLYDCLGWSHFCLGNYAEALNFLMKALSIADEIEDPSLRAYVLESIANVHRATGEPGVSLETHQRALAVHRELGDSMGEALVLNNLAYTYLDLNDFPAALDAAQAALRYAEAEGRHHLRMWVLDTLADVYVHLGNAEAAERYTYRALELARDCNSETDEASGMMMLGRVAYLRGSWDVALAAANVALEITERRHLVVQSYECHKLISQIQEKRGDAESALAHYKRYHELKQAKINEETESRLANLRVTHQVETARKDAEIQRLRTLALEQEVEERKVAQARLEARASLDPLTGLFNRAHMSVLAEQLHLGLEQHRPVSLIMIDIDRFKQVNDEFGHLAGDAALVAIARELAANARDTDVPCRYGGDEFLMLLVGTDSEAATRTAERLREQIASLRIRYGEARIPVAISAGVASAAWNTPVDFQTLVERADRALYAAKQSGRNRVITYPDPVATVPAVSDATA